MKSLSMLSICQLMLLLLIDSPRPSEGVGVSTACWYYCALNGRNEIHLKSDGTAFVLTNLTRAIKATYQIQNNRITFVNDDGSTYSYRMKVLNDSTIKYHFVSDNENDPDEEFTLYKFECSSCLSIDEAYDGFQERISKNDCELTKP